MENVEKRFKGLNIADVVIWKDSMKLSHCYKTGILEIKVLFAMDSKSRLGTST